MDMCTMGSKTEVIQATIEETARTTAAHTSFIIKPADVQTVPACTSSAARLMIKQIAIKNFKSYAGVHMLGPFHKNGAAKNGSNTNSKITKEAILFVLGYRAKEFCFKKKISKFIHRSEKHQDITSCAVAVHFQKILDTEVRDDHYAVVPKSQFRVSRLVFKDNSYKYFLDGKKINYQDMVNGLVERGIDLNHSHFLIQWDEVQQIAMMRPKALTEQDEGLLEWLEGFIGTNRLREDIDNLSRELDTTLSGRRSEQLDRLNALEKGLEYLERLKNESVEFLNAENALVKLKNKFYQKNMVECADQVNRAQIEYNKAIKHHEWITSMYICAREYRIMRTDEYNIVKMEYEKLMVDCEDYKNKISEIESQSIRCKEDIKLNMAKYSSLIKQKGVDISKIDEICLVMKYVIKNLKNLELLEMAKEEENVVMDTLVDQTEKSAMTNQETEVLTAVIPVKANTLSLQSQMDVFDTECEMVNKLKKEASSLHKLITETLNAKFSDDAVGNIDQIIDQIHKMTVCAKASNRSVEMDLPIDVELHLARDSKRVQEKIASFTDNLEEMMKILKNLTHKNTETLTQRLKKIESLTRKLKQLKEEKANLTKLYENHSVCVREKEKIMEVMKKYIDGLKKQEVDMASDKVYMQTEAWKYNSFIQAQHTNLKDCRRKMELLKLKPITGDEEQTELVLPSLDNEELQSFGKMELKFQIHILAGKVEQLKPNSMLCRQTEIFYCLQVEELEQLSIFTNKQQGLLDSLRNQRLENFMTGFQAIASKLKEMYQIFSPGGDAQLELVDYSRPFSEGVNFSVRPPNKSWKNISSLSEPEKILASLALMFAVHIYKPAPFYLMYDIGPVLDLKDFTNITTYFQMFTKNPQLFIMDM